MLPTFASQRLLKLITRVQLVTLTALPVFHIKGIPSLELATLNLIDVKGNLAPGSISIYLLDAGGWELMLVLMPGGGTERSISSQLRLRAQMPCLQLLSEALQESFPFRSGILPVQFVFNCTQEFRYLLTCQICNCSSLRIIQRHS